MSEDIRRWSLGTRYVFERTNTSIGFSDKRHNVRTEEEICKHNQGKRTHDHMELVVVL